MDSPEELLDRAQCAVGRWKSAAPNGNIVAIRQASSSTDTIDDLMGIAVEAFSAPTNSAASLYVKAYLLSELADPDGDLVHQLARELGRELSTFFQPQAPAEK